MNLKILFSDLKNTPFQFLIPKVRSQVLKKQKLKAIRKVDELESTFKIDAAKNWNHLFSIDELSISNQDIEDLKLLSAKFQQHTFDILGSSWLPWKYSTPSKGFLGASYPNQIIIDDFDEKGNWLSQIVSQKNHEYSASLWKEILRLNPEYKPIDWSRDMKSGYRFGSDLHFSLVKKIPGLKGVDVKIPWEMGRLQHLPLMTLCGIHSKSNELIDEVQCQLLDFVMSNPPRMGVQWSSTMDSAIRLFNIVIVMDALLQSNPDLTDSEFYTVISSTVKQHLDFCWQFKEDKDGLSNNHYLANLLGVLSASFALYDIEDDSNILELATNELLKELDKQFLPDGGNFESSLPYHFFATEIGILSLAIMQGILSDKKFIINIDRSLFSKVEVKLRRAYQICDVTIHEGIIPQIGDNDSARMFYWNRPYELISTASYNEKYLNQASQEKANVIDVNYLDYTSTMHYLHGYFISRDSSSLHSSFVKSIMKNGKVGQYSSNKSKFQSLKKEIKLAFTKTSHYKSTANLKINLKAQSFENFGIYVFRSDRLFLCVNAMNRHVQQYWPHSHNDKLSIELWIDQKPIVRDPGSYVYTADWQLRNKYRSAGAHSSILISSIEQNTWLRGIEGVFRTIPLVKVDVLAFEEDYIVLRACYSGVIHIREIFIEENGIRMIDHCNKKFMVNQFPDIKFSNGYGKMLA